MHVRQRRREPHFCVSLNGCIFCCRIVRVFIVYTNQNVSAQLRIEILKKLHRVCVRFISMFDCFVYIKHKKAHQTKTNIFLKRKARQEKGADCRAEAEKQQWQQQRQQQRNSNDTDADNDNDMAYPDSRCVFSVNIKEII